MRCKHRRARNAIARLLMRSSQQCAYSEVVAESSFIAAQERAGPPTQAERERKSSRVSSIAFSSAMRARSTCRWSRARSQALAQGASVSSSARNRANPLDRKVEIAQAPDEREALQVFRAIKASASRSPRRRMRGPWRRRFSRNSVKPRPRRGFVRMRIRIPSTATRRERYLVVENFNNGRSEFRDAQSIAEATRAPNSAPAVNVQACRQHRV